MILKNPVFHHPASTRDDPDLRPKQFRAPDGTIVLAALACDFGVLYDEAGGTLGETRFAPQDFIVTDFEGKVARIVSEAEFDGYVPM